MTKLQHFITGIAGISFEQENAKKVQLGDKVNAVRDYDNAFDACAISIVTQDGKSLGFLPTSVASTLVREQGNNVSLSGTVVEVLEGKENVGLRVKLAVEPTFKNETTEGVYSPGGRRLGSFIEEKNGKVFIQTEYGILTLSSDIVEVKNS